MRNILGVLGLAATATACSTHKVTDLSGGIQQCGFLFAPRPCRALGIDPDDGAYLRGDTIRVGAFSDSGYGRVSWTVIGNAAQFISAAGLTTELPADTGSVRMIALQTGGCTVTATATAAPVSASAMLIGTSTHASAQLRIRSTVLMAYATQWFSSDTSVAVVVQVPRQPQAVRDAYRVVGRRPGQVYVGAAFLDVRDSLLLKIIP